MMNNSAFRDLLSKPPSSSGQNGNTLQFKAPTLGSRTRSSIPMTPRNIKGYNNKSEFARQVAEQTQADGPPSKRFKSSSAPKGSRLAQGYVDRAAVLREQGDGQAGQDDRETRLKALEDMLKLQQITEDDFQQLKADMGIGGDTSSTHLVKGLDWKLLARVRRGEDVSKNDAGQRNDADNETEKEDLDEELEKAVEVRSTPVGEAGQPLDKQSEEMEDAHERPKVVTRDELLGRLKESRKVATGTVKTVAAPVVLNDKFKKVAAPEKPSKHKYTEVVNGRRRQVLEIRKSDGTMKRKTRWIDPEDVSRSSGSQPWGMDVPAELSTRATDETPEEEADDDDIFQGVGADYDPLAQIGGDESDGDEGDKDQCDNKVSEAIAPVPTTIGSSTKRNYFATSEEAGEEAVSSNPLAGDPTILAAVKRAADIRRRDEQDGVDPESSDAMPNVKQKAFLQKLKERDRQDNADLDYGFGDSRFGDDDDEGEVYVDEDANDKKSGRKRGPKKRKGDKNDVKDVMGVLEGRKQKT